MGDALCFAGCGAPVARSGSRCDACRKAFEAARKRVNRGQPATPSLPPDAATAVSDALEAALEAARGLARARREAEHIQAGDGVPLDQVDLWLTPLEAHLEKAERDLAAWRRTARDIQRSVGIDP